MDFTNYNSSILGLFGLDEEFKLCHLPFLLYNQVYGCVALEGSSGTGKTTLIKRLGLLNLKVGGGKVGVFSADKAKYEDFIGCPIPDSITKEMVIYPHPNSVSQMETIVVDEINRASYDNQEKWLSLFATREIDGIDVSCKYIYAAMNPILAENNEVYEGTQPLDKALGERMMCLIKMPEFADLKSDHRLKILKETQNQVQWIPSDEAVELHRAFIKAARETYDSVRSRYMDSAADYVDAVQASLKHETRGAITIEARRAQFIYNNILAVHSLNLVFNPKASLESSALDALLISFPNPLWEQPISKEALHQVHTRNTNLLKPSETKVISISNSLGDLNRTLDTLRELVNREDTSLEIMSKAINNELPSEDLNPLNHLVYLLGAIGGLTWKESGITEEFIEKKEGENLEQHVMKNQEFARFISLKDKFMKSEAYVKVKKLAKLVEEAEEGECDLDYTELPYYMQQDGDQDSISTFNEMLKGELGRASIALADYLRLKVNGISDLLNIMTKVIESLAAFKDINITFKKSEK